MRPTVRGAAPRAGIGFIILPMIDVIFLLLLFFVMVTTFEASARVRVDVPDPEDSQARKADLSERLVINCEYVAPAGSKPFDVRYRIGGDPPQSLDDIAARLAAAGKSNPNSVVLIRADRRLPNAPVREVIRLVSETGLQKIDVCAKQDLER